MKKGVIGKLFSLKEMPTRIEWDDFFMTMVYLVAAKSKDPDTHIGAVVIGPDKEIRTTGYNGLPRWTRDDVPERMKRPEKYLWFEHAERNAIYNATLMGVSLKNCKMYTNGVPCANCARGVIQSGIKEVIVDVVWDGLHKADGDVWSEEAKRSMQMFKEAGVKVRFWNGMPVQIVRYRRGQKISFKNFISI